ncbi:MAG TPA: esterase-like activity of phytase family protein, partial [Thermoanaerobaculia bacterium]|nr:esterase-like activity of phytase family protein [Thermoanaerobaculia bacterium]
MEQAAAATLRVVAHAVLLTGTQFGGYEVGGLSGLAYDAKADLFYAVSDDAAGHPPAKVLRFRWHPVAGHPPAAPELVDWLPLVGKDGPFPTAGADLEGLARAPNGELYVSSEGDVEHGITPWVAHFDAAGKLRDRLPIPDAFLPAEKRGVRHNAAFEALTVLGDDNLVAGTEGPLRQDEPPPAGELARTR